MKIKMEGFDRPVGPDPKARRRMLQMLGNIMIDIIHRRVDRGKSLGGGTFKKYTKSYYEYKRAIGRSPESTGDWLRLTGKMMASHVITELTSEKVVVGFRGSRPGGGPKSPGQRKARARKRRALRKQFGKQAHLYKEAIEAELDRGRKPPEMIANALLAFVNNARRPFVGLSPVEKKQARDRMIDWAKVMRLI